MTLQSLIHTYGYAAVAVGCFFEGETVLVLAAVAAHLGMLSIVGVVAMAAVGGFLGDCLWFALGRRYGSRIVTRFPWLAQRIVRARATIDRHGSWIVLLMRFAIGVRIAIPVALGSAGMPAARYLMLNALGVAIWATVFGTVGFVFGAAVTAFVERAKRDVEIALGLAFAAMFVYFIVMLIRRRRAARPPAGMD
jgi:membrane protein DedA with SNARE-associated domain